MRDETLARAARPRASCRSTASATSVSFSSPSPTTMASRNGGHRLGMGRGRTAGDDQRIVFAAVGRAQRDAAEIEHGEAVGVGELVLEREADDVEVRSGRALSSETSGSCARAELAPPCRPTACSSARRACADRRSGSCRGSCSRGGSSRCRRRRGTRDRPWLAPRPNPF